MPHPRFNIANIVRFSSACQDCFRWRCIRFIKKIYPRCRENSLRIHIVWTFFSLDILANIDPLHRFMSIKVVCQCYLTDDWTVWQYRTLFFRGWFQISRVGARRSEIAHYRLQIWTNNCSLSDYFCKRSLRFCWAFLTATILAFLQRLLSEFLWRDT